MGHSNSSQLIYFTSVVKGVSHDSNHEFKCNRQKVYTVKSSSLLVTLGRVLARYSRAEEKNWNQFSIRNANQVSYTWHALVTQHTHIQRRLTATYTQNMAIPNLQWYLKVLVARIKLLDQCTCMQQIDTMNDLCTLIWRRVTGSCKGR